MSAILVGWYLPVFVLMIRDPLIREVLKDACVTGSIATAKGIATFFRWGGVTLFRNSLKILRERRLSRIRAPPVEEDWYLVQ